MQQNKVGTQQMMGPLFPSLYPGGFYWYFPRQQREDGVVLAASDEASAPTGDPPV